LKNPNVNPLDNIPRHLFPPPVVEFGGSQTVVLGKILHVLERHALRQQISDGRHAKRVR
jgi:hypothetical protein